MATALATALIAVAVPRIITWFDNLTRPTVVVTVQDQHEDAGDHVFVLPYVVSRSTAAAMGTPATFFADPNSYHAIKVAGDNILMVVEGKSSHTVVVTQIRAKILTRRSAVTGTLIDTPAEGMNNDVRVGLNLDDADPVAHAFGTNGTFADPYFDHNAVTLNDGETETFSVEALANESYDYSWEIELSLVVDGAQQTRVIDSNGAPFELTGYAPRYAAAYGMDRGGWVSEGPKTLQCVGGKC